MAITTVNLTYLGTAPTKTGQVLASELRGNDSRTLYATATYTGDSSTSTATLNYIDGTEFLSFTPSAILFSRSGGSATGTVVPTNIVDSGSTSAGKTAAVTFSATFSGTIIIALEILK